MADKSEGSTSAPSASKAGEAASPTRPLNADDVRRLVDGMGGDLRDADLSRLSENLRADPGGKVSAALNQLRRLNPKLVLAELVLALRVAAAIPHIPDAKKRAAEARDHARRLRELAVEAKAKVLLGGISLEARTLEGFAKQYETDAAKIDEVLRRGIWSRKSGDIDRAYVGAASRDLARRLFPNERANLAAIAWLLAAALGRRITAKTVANAVRSTARTNARSKPKTAAERAYSEKR